MIDVLKGAFVEGLGLKGDVDWGSLAYRSVPEWDSLGHMTLIAAIETVFDIMLDIDDVIGMSSFIVAQKIVAKYASAA